MEKSEKNGLVALLLNIVFPPLAYLYVGKLGKALIAVPLAPLLYVINTVRIILGKYTDSEGKTVKLS